MFIYPPMRGTQQIGKFRKLKKGGKKKQMLTTTYLTYKTYLDYTKEFIDGVEFVRNT